MLHEYAPFIFSIYAIALLIIHFVIGRGIVQGEESTTRKDSPKEFWLVQLSLVICAIVGLGVGLIGLQ
jgi:hypothetical protein